MISYGILSVKNFPFLNSFLENLNKKSCLPKIILFDNKLLTNEEIERYCLRTGKKYSDIKLYKENQYAISYSQVQDHNNIETFKIIKGNDLDFLVNLGTPRILKEKIINSTKLGILNCHPGLLPEFKGCCCVEWSIFKDEPVGNTLHWMDTSIDSGPIISRHKTECFYADSYQKIRNRVYNDGSKVLVELISLMMQSSFYSIRKNLSGKIFNGGNYYKPMNDITLSKVIEKIENHKYKYQNN